MKKLILLSMALLSVSAITAQTLGENELKELKSSFVNDGYAKTIHNIVVANKGLKGLAYDASVAQNADDFFKYNTDVKGITDQKSSGRCWMFTSMNFLRPAVMKKYNVNNFDFSHNYSFFWDMLEKSNLFLEAVINTASKPFGDRAVDNLFQNPIGDGGVWNLFLNIGDKYGVVPAEIMPETEHSNNTSQMNALLKEILRKGGYEVRELYEKMKYENYSGPMGDFYQRAQKIKMRTLKDVYRVLAICLGEPPTEFTWKFRDADGKVQTVKTTPIEFYKGVIPADYNADDYVMIMNDPTREYYKIYEIDMYRNTYEGVNWKYLNLPNEDIKEAALASIKNGEPMYASCDVGKQSNTASGVGYLDPGMYNLGQLFGVDLTMDKKARILTRQSGSSHAMLIVACDTDDNDVPTKWKFENSWGPNAGKGGYLIFTDKWFDEYMFRMVINRKYLGKKAIKALGQKPVMLPAWDYMF